MGKATYGTGTLLKRGWIWYVSYWVEGKQIQRSSKSANIQDAKRMRDQILGQKARGEIGIVAPDQVTCGELLNDLLDHAGVKIKASTARIWELVIEANIGSLPCVSAYPVRAESRHRIFWSRVGISDSVTLVRPSPSETQEVLA